VGLPVVLLGAYFIADWYAGHQWQSYAAAARARGVKLTLAEWFDRPAIPEEENFAALPMWKPNFGEPGYMPELPYPAFAGRKKLPSAGQRRLDLERYRLSMVKSKWVSEEGAEGGDAEVVLRGLHKFDAQFHQLQEGFTRPHSRFVVNVSDPLNFDFSHLAKIGRLATAWELKINAELASGDSATALADWLVGWTFARVTEEDFVALSLILRNGAAKAATDEVWAGLNLGIWNDEQLQVIEQRLAAENLLAHYPAIMKGDRGWFNDVFERLARTHDTTQFFISGRALSKPEEWLLKFSARQSRWWRKNQLWVNHFYDEEAASLDAAGERWLPRTGRRYDPAQLATGWVGVDLFAARESTIYYEDHRRRVTFAHVRLRLAGLGCALERYRRAKGGYPEKIEQLVPDFVAKLPHEPTNGEPFLYRPHPKDGYRLYSIGWNGIDDDGSVVTSDHDISAESPDWRWWAPNAAEPVPPTAK
jgi:hypothetical protein